MEQGRVQLDSDWNEWLAELARRIQAGTLDIFGHAAYPATTPCCVPDHRDVWAPNTVTSARGRMYVDGLLAENHGDPATASVGSRAGRALRRAAAAATPHARIRHPVDFTKQPYLPGRAVCPPDTGPYLFYLDVWPRAVTWLEDPDLIDKAVGVDTTGRMQTVWQVKCRCQTPPAGPAPRPTRRSGRRSASTACSRPVLSRTRRPGPCCLTDGSGYTGMENQFYRVEIHQPGTAQCDGRRQSRHRYLQVVARQRLGRDRGHRDHDGAELRQQPPASSRC